MSRKRAHITLKAKLASALLSRGEIPDEDAKLMTADQIISLYHFDHGILHAHGGSNEPWNLTPRLIAEHRQKSRRDTSVVAKVERIGNAQVVHLKAIRTKLTDERETFEPRKMQSRGFMRGHRPLRSRNTLQKRSMP